MIRVVDDSTSVDRVTESYTGPVSLDDSDETVYLDLEIDDLDSGSWVGTVASAESVLGVDAAGEYRVRLLADPHGRRRQTAKARGEQGSDSLYLRGNTSFE